MKSGERLAPLPAAEADGLWVEPVYRQRGYEEALPEVWVRDEVARRLMLAARWLRERRLGLLVWDGWRPLGLQGRLWREYGRELAATTGLAGEELESLLETFVSPPSGDHAAHSTGGAVDLTLCSAQGGPLAMGGEFDELTSRSHPDYYERVDLAPPEVEFRDRRRLLERAMEEGGFMRLPTEWWHFEYGTERWATWSGQPQLFDSWSPGA